MKRMLAAVAAMILGLAGLSALPLASASAQGSQWNVRTITVFGTDRCPPDTICVRAPESERYRIPRDLRGDTGLALAERWGDRAKSLEYAGQGGISSCSPVGPGGVSGCFNQLMRQARTERQEQGEKTAVPLDLP